MLNFLNTNIYNYNINKLFWFKVFKLCNNNTNTIKFFITKFHCIKNLDDLNKFLIKKRKRVIIKQKKFLVRNIKNLVKKKSNQLSFFLRFNFLVSYNILTLPSLNTFLSLYGINSQKFFEEYNRTIKSFFFENVIINLYLYIFKDLSFKIVFSLFKYNFFLQSVFFDMNFIFKRTQKINEKNLKQLFFLHKFFYNESILFNNNIIDKVDTFYKNYSVYDFWFLNFNLKQAFNMLKNKNTTITTVMNNKDKTINVNDSDLFDKVFFFKSSTILKILFNSFLTFYNSLKLKTVLYKINLK